MIEWGKRVKVYRNLRTGNFSIVDPKTGRVIARKDNFYLMNCAFKVGLKSQARIRERGVRGIHAYVWGDYMGTLPDNVLDGMNVKKVYYNPFQDTWFNDGENMITAGEIVLFVDQAAYISN